MNSGNDLKNLNMEHILDDIRGIPYSYILRHIWSSNVAMSTTWFQMSLNTHTKNAHIFRERANMARC